MSTQILGGDCSVILPTIDTNSVHMVLTDPPYNTLGMDVTGNGGKWDAYHLPLGVATREKRATLPPGKAMPFKREQAEELYKGLLPVACELLRVLVPGALALVMGAPRTCFATAQAFHDAGFEIRDQMLWFHNGGQPKAQELNRFNSNVPIEWKTPQPRQQFEVVWLARKPSLLTMTDTFLQHGVGLMNCATEMPAQTLNFSKPSPAEKASRGGHPTTKPVALFSRLIELFSQSGQTILDPFAGSGTTGIAARQTGRNSILIEQDEKYLKNLEVLLEE